MARIARLAALVFILVALNGCASRVVYSVPEKLGTRGLLVAYVYSDTYPGAMQGAPAVDMTTYHGGQNDGYIVLALSPGEHTLNGIYQHKSTITVPIAAPMVSGNMYITDAASFEIERKFRIEAGRVTNLGMIVIRAPRAVGSTPNVLYLDNTADMKAVVASAFPSLHASLVSPEFLANGLFENAASVQNLRNSAVAAKLRSGTWQAEHPDATYVAAAYGAIARIRPSGSNATFQLIPTPTLKDLSACSLSVSYVACVISDSTFLFVESDEATVRMGPPGVLASSVHVVGDRDIVLIDHAMNFYVSSDKGDTWGNAVSFNLTKPVAAGMYTPDNKSRFHMAVGREKTYFYSVDVDQKSSGLVSRSPNGTLERLALPPGADYLRRVKETDAALFVVGHSDLWLLPQGESAWQTRKLPAYDCSEVAFGDRAGAHIELSCGEGLLWTSKDGGRTWNRIFKPQSLFAEK